MMNLEMKFKSINKIFNKLSKTNKNKQVNNQSFGLKLFAKSKLNKQIK